MVNKTTRIVLCLLLAINPTIYATVTIVASYPTGNPDYTVGDPISYIVEADWGSQDNEVNQIRAFILDGDYDPDLGTVITSEYATKSTGVQYSDSSGFYIGVRTSLVAQLASGDYIGGFYYLTFKPSNVSAGGYRLYPPDMWPQLYTSKSITISP